MNRRSMASFWLASMVIGVRQQVIQWSNVCGPVVACMLFVYLFSHVWLIRDTSLLKTEAVKACWYTLIGEVGIFSFGRSQMLMLQRCLPREIIYQTLRPRIFFLRKVPELWGAGLWIAFVLSILPVLYLSMTLGFPAGVTLGKVFLFSVSYGVATLLRTLVVLNIVCLSFWLDKTDSIFWLYSQLALMVGVLMPISFYPKVVQNIVWLTPLPALSHVPTVLLLEPIESWWTGLLNQFLWLIVLMWVAHVLFCRGSKYYLERQS